MSDSSFQAPSLPHWGALLSLPNSFAPVYKLTLSQSPLQWGGQGLPHTLEHSPTALVEHFTSSEYSDWIMMLLDRIVTKTIHMYTLCCRGVAADKNGVLGSPGLNQALPLSSPVISGKSLNLTNLQLPQLQHGGNNSASLRDYMSSPYTLRTTRNCDCPALIVIMAVDSLMLYSNWKLNPTQDRKHHGHDSNDLVLGCLPLWIFILALHSFHDSWDSLEFLNLYTRYVGPAFQKVCSPSLFSFSFSKTQ